MTLTNFQRICAFSSLNIVRAIVVIFSISCVQAAERVSVAENANNGLINPDIDTREFLLLEEMFQLALKENPSMISASARVNQAVGLVRQFGSYRFPKVDLTGSFGPEFNDPSPNSEVGYETTNGRKLKLVATKLLFDGGASRSEYDRSKSLKNSAVTEAQVALENVYLEVVNHYTDYWRYQQELAEADEFVDSMQKLVSALEEMYRSGAASKIEVDFARARLASAQGLVSTTTASLNNALSELEYLSPGLKSFIAISLEEFSTLNLLSLSDYLERGARDNSELLINEHSIEAAQLRISALKGKLLPSVSLEVGGSVIDDEGGPSVQRDKIEAKLTVNYTLYSGGERRGGLYRAKELLRELESERTQLKREVFRSIDQSYNSITAAKVSLSAISNEIAANEELQLLNRKNLEIGTVNIIELIDVEERLFNARARRFETVATMHQKHNELMVLSGHAPLILAEHSQALQSDSAYLD